MDSKMFTQNESKVISDKIADKDNQKNGVGYRQMHTLTAIYDQEYYDTYGGGSSANGGGGS